MSNLSTSEQGQLVASASNDVAYPPLPEPPNAESDNQSDERKGSSAVDNSVGKQAVSSGDKLIKKPVEDKVKETADEATEETAEGADDGTDDEDSGASKMTLAQKFKIVEAILEAKEENKDIQAAIEKALPANVSANFRQIQAAVHSDKFSGDEGKEEKAKEAFQSEKIMIVFLT